MRDARALIFLAVGLLLAGLTGLALFGLAQQVSQPRAAAATPTATVLVAAMDLPTRTVVSADMLAERSYPAELLPAGALSNPADAIGQTTLAPISRGQTIVAGQLAAAEGKRGASVTLAPGSVLVSFPTSDPLTIGGLVNVGDRVDVLASVVVGAGDSTRVSQTTLQNLEVVDIVGPTKDQPQRATALVFAVDHQVALVLKYLRDSQAAIDLAIRSRAEKDAVRTVGVDKEYVVQTYGLRR